MSSKFRYSDDEDSKSFGCPYAIIVDQLFYFINEKQINEWCRYSIPNTGIQGMVIRFNNSSDQLLFRLTWE